MYFQTRGSGTVSNRMVIDELGNIGIGTTSPSYKLDVETLLTGNQTIASFKTSESVYNGLLIAANNNAGWVGNGHITADEGILFQDTSSAIRFYTDSAEKMRITSTGNVGIGTSSPSGKLHIQNSAASNYALRFAYTDGTDGGGF